MSHDPSFDHSKPATRALGVPLGNPKARRLNKLQRVDVEDMAKLIGYKMQEDLYLAEYWTECSRYHLNDGATEDQARDLADRATEKEENRLMVAQMESIKTAFEAMLDDHGMELCPMKRSKWLYRILPCAEVRGSDSRRCAGNGWRHAAQCIRGTINGVGLFQFDNLKDFLDSGPYTMRQAVLEHLHWMKDYPRVYGDKPYADRVSFE